MKADWKAMSLREAGVQLIDCDHRTPPAADAGYPYVAIPQIKNGRIDFSNARRITREHFVEWTRKAHPQKFDVVLSRRCNPGETAFVASEADFALGQNLVLLRAAGSRVYPPFLRWLVRGREWWEQVGKFINVGAVFDSLRCADVPNFELTIPNIKEQRVIANVLGTLDDKIELDRRMNKTLEAIARALFKSWFVDFDPVRAKVEGRNLRLPKPLASLFPDSFQGSELGKIPTGWEVKTIDSIAKRVGMGPFGSSIKVETFVSQGVPVISGQHLHGFMMEDNTFNFITLEHAQRLKNANTHRGDVIFTHAGNIGQASYIPENSRYERYVISQRQFFMRCDLAQVIPSFVAFYFGSPEGQHRLLANTSSSGVPSIARPVTYLRSIELTIPPKSIMDAFHGLVEPLLEQFQRNQNEIHTLAALRDALLPKLLSGEVHLKDAARVCEESVHA